GLDRDERAARGREVAGLDEARGHTAGERRRHAGLTCDGGGCFHRAFALLNGAFRLLVLHPVHVELERRGGARGRKGLVAFVVALGEVERRASLRERAPSLCFLPPRRLGVVLDADVSGGGGLFGARGHRDDVRHDAARDGGRAVCRDGAVENQPVRQGGALDQCRGGGHRRKIFLRRRVGGAAAESRPGRDEADKHFRRKSDLSQSDLHRFDLPQSDLLHSVPPFKMLSGRRPALTASLRSFVCASARATSSRVSASRRAVATSRRSSVFTTPARNRSFVMRSASRAASSAFFAVPCRASAVFASSKACRTSRRTPSPNRATSSRPARASSRAATTAARSAPPWKTFQVATAM